MPRKKKEEKRPRGSGSVKLRGRFFSIKYYLNGVPVEESTGLTDRDEALALLAKKVADVRYGEGATVSPSAHGLTMGDLFKLVVADYKKKGQDTTAEVESKIKNHLGDIAKVVAEDLSDDHIDPFIAKRQKAGAANATINRELSIIVCAQNLAWKRKPRLIKQPLYIKLLPENNVRKQEVTNDAYVKVLGVIASWWRMVLVLMYHCPTRIEEILGLEWTQIDWDYRVIRLNPGETKSDEPRELAFYGDLEEWLKAQYAERNEKFPNCPWVCHRNGKRMKTTYKAWKSAVAAAGYSDLTPHDCRRAAIRNLTRNGVTREVIKRLSGHETDSAFDRYKYATASDLEQVREKMAGVIPSTPVEQFRPKPAAAPKAKNSHLGTVSFEAKRRSPRKYRAFMSWGGKFRAIGRFASDEEARAALREKYQELVALGLRSPLPDASV